MTEALAYLLERAGAQEGQLARLCSDLQHLLDRAKEQDRQLTKLTIAAGKRDEQIEGLYSRGVSLAESVQQQSNYIKNLEERLNRWRKLTS